MRKILGLIIKDKPSLILILDLISFGPLEAISRNMTLGELTLVMELVWSREIWASVFSWF